MRLDAKSYLEQLTARRVPLHTWRIDVWRYASRETVTRNLYFEYLERNLAVIYHVVSPIPRDRSVKIPSENLVAQTRRVAANVTLVSVRRPRNV